MTEDGASIAKLSWDYYSSFCYGSTYLPYTDEKYPVEITPTGTIPMPLLVRKKNSNVMLSKPTLPYKLQCPVCHKVFRRKAMNNRKLNRHKGQYGNVCSGKYGSFI